MHSQLQQLKLEAMNAVLVYFLLDTYLSHWYKITTAKKITDFSQVTKEWQISSGPFSATALSFVI